MPIKLSFVIDLIFCTICSLFLLLILFSSFIPYPLNIIWSGLVCIFLSIIYFNLFRKKQKEIFLKKEDENKLEDMLCFFDFSPDEKTMDFFEKLFISLGYKTEKKGNVLYFKDKAIAVLIKLGFNNVDKADVVRFYNNLRKNDLGYVVSETFSADIKDFILRFNGRLISADAISLYHFLKEKNALPQNIYNFNNKEKKKLKLFSNLLNKKKAKNFFFFGLIFLFTSAFLPIKTYYVIFGFVFLSFSLFLRLFGKNQTN